MKFQKINSIIDLYGFKPRLFINGYAKKGTIIGIIFSLITWIFMIVITVYYLNKLFINKELHTLTSIRSATSSDVIYLDKNNFFFAFALEDPRYNVYIDEEIYYPEVFYKHGVRDSTGKFDYSDATKLTTEPCSVSDFGEKFQKLVETLPLNNMYCIRNLNYTLTGSFAADEYSFIVLNMYVCKNTTEKTCKTQDRLNYYLDGAFFTFQYQNYILDPNDFNEPFKPKMGDYMTTISKKYYKNLYVYLKKYLLSTDTDLIFESKEDEHKTIYDYGSDMITFQESSNFMQLTFRMSLDVNEVSRSYTKAQTIISYIGGFITFLQTVLSLLIELLTSSFIYEKIINKIFFFSRSDEEIHKLNILKKYNLSLSQSKKNVIISKRNNGSYNKNNESNYNSSNNSIYLNEESANKNSKKFFPSEIILNKNFQKNKFNQNNKDNSSILNIKNNQIKKNTLLARTKTFSFNLNKNINNNISVTKLNLLPDNKKLIMNHFFIKGKQKKRKKLINSYFKRLFYKCFKSDENINLFYKGIKIIKQKLDIISIIKDSFHIELIKNFYFEKEHVVLLDDFIKNEIMEYKFKENKFDIDKDIIVNDDIIKSFEVILNRNLHNKNNNKNDEKNKIDKYFIDTIIRQNQ